MKESGDVSDFLAGGLTFGKRESGREGKGRGKETGQAAEVGRERTAGKGRKRLETAGQTEGSGFWMDASKRGRQK